MNLDGVCLIEKGFRDKSAEIRPEAGQVPSPQNNQGMKEMARAGDVLTECLGAERYRRQTLTRKVMTAGTQANTEGRLSETKRK